MCVIILCLDVQEEQDAAKHRHGQAFELPHLELLGFVGPELDQFGDPQKPKTNIF